MVVSIRSFFSTAALLSALISTCTSAPTGDDLAKRARVAPSLAGPEHAIAPGTYPRANKLQDSSIIGVYTAFADGNSIITTTHSTDGGATWQRVGEVTRASTDANDLDNPYILQLPTGRLLVAFRNHSKDPATGLYTAFRITVSYSDDRGKSWKFLSTPASDPGPVLGNWEPYLRNAPSGLQLFYSRENSAQDQDTMLRTSSDGGKTWSTAKTISGTDVTARDGMSSAVTVSDSTLMCVFESFLGGVFSLYSITSADNGVNWGNRQTVYKATGTNNNAGSPQIINVGGTLVVSFMTDEDTQQHAWPAGANTKIVTSGDGGKTWGNKITIAQQQANWPGMMTIDDDSLLVFYDRDGNKVQEVTLK